MLTPTNTSTQQPGDATPTLAMGRDEVDPSGVRLAATVRDALRAAPYVPEDDLDVEVRDHAVYLSGMVKWDHQRVAAERAVEDLVGVHVLRNGIRVRPRASASDIEAKILDALNYGMSDSPVAIEVDDEAVTLTGAVASYTDRLKAEHAALSVPHVRSVCNRLRIVKA